MKTFSSVTPITSVHLRQCLEGGGGGRGGGNLLPPFTG
jgi:hypothetical protein